MTQTTTTGRVTPTAFIRRPTLWRRTAWLRLQAAWIGRLLAGWTMVMYVLGLVQIAYEADQGSSDVVRGAVGVIAVLYTLSVGYELVRWWSHDPRTDV